MNYLDYIQDVLKTKIESVGITYQDNYDERNVFQDTSTGVIFPRLDKLANYDEQNVSVWKQYNHLYEIYVFQKIDGIDKEVNKIRNTFYDLKTQLQNELRVKEEEDFTFTDATLNQRITINEILFDSTDFKQTKDANAIYLFNIIINYTLTN